MEWFEHFQLRRRSHEHHPTYTGKRKQDEHWGPRPWHLLQQQPVLNSKQGNHSITLYIRMQHMENKLSHQLVLTTKMLFVARIQLRSTTSRSLANYLDPWISILRLSNTPSSSSARAKLISVATIILFHLGLNTSKRHGQQVLFGFFDFV